MDTIKVVLYGTGRRSENVLMTLKILSEFEIVSVVDGNSQKHGLEWNGYQIQSPESLLKTNFDCLLIASVAFAEIVISLLNILPPNKLEQAVDAHTFLQSYVVVKQTVANQEHFCSNEKQSINKGEKIVIYTAMFGNYDDLKTPEFIGENIDYVCFTDNQNLKSDIWEVRIVDEAFACSNRAAKVYKILPHHYFREYTWSIWVDASYLIHKDMRELLENYMGKENILFFPHNARDCAYDEAEICKAYGLDQVEKIEEQMMRYQEEGYPEHHGLICGSCIMRKHNEPDVKAVMEQWWHEISKGSRRDQLSFNYSAWKLNKGYHFVPENVENNSYFTIHTHKKSR